ncbi:MAG: PEP-CTERM sorting domain-containing protein, partial [Kiritimatiellia bacterium]
MNKLALVALLLCFATVAPAVTLSWNASIDRTDGIVSGDYGVAIIYGACEGMDASTFKTLLTDAGDSQHPFRDYSVTDSNVGSAVVLADGSTYTYSPKMDSLSGIFDTNGNTSVTFVVLNWGQLENGGLTMVTVGNLSVDATVNLGTIMHDGTLKHTTTSATAVPEPTVFALLALGVAGVALRR